MSLPLQNIWARSRSALDLLGRPVTLEVPPSLQPMEALPVHDLPTGKGWLFEPKYDGFRCILFRDGHRVDLQSRRQVLWGAISQRSSMPHATSP